MAFGFNPFTGNFDLTGGGDAAPFAGQVDAYADLPLDTTAALNSRWLVKNNSGTWPFSTYKQAGIYIRVSTVGASRDTDYQFVGTLPSVMNDSEFLIYDNVDATRNLKFDVGTNVPTGTTRTLTVPNASGRIQVEGQPIGNVTASTGAFTTLSASSTISPANATASPPTTLTQASGIQWSSLGGTFSNTASIYGSFAGTPTLGIGVGASAGSTTEIAAFNLNGITFNRALTGASNVIEMVNGNNAQTFRIYRTSTDASNYERGFMRWSSNILQIGTEAAGTGSLRNIGIGSNNGNIIVSIGTRTSNDDNNTGLFSNPSANQCSIGAYLNSVRVASVGVFIYAPNSAGSASIPHMRCDSGLIRLFTESSSSTAHPAFKNSGSTLQIRLANDSGFAPLSCGALTLNGDLTASTRNIVTDTTTGTKIGTATTQKIGFFNATPVVQQAAVADATDAASTQARLNDLLARLRTLGLIAT
jgi:hypothetical protein